jgi:hypothetical protein
VKGEKWSTHKPPAGEYALARMRIKPPKPYTRLVEDPFTFHLSLFTAAVEVISTLAPTPHRQLFQPCSFLSISATFASSSFTRWLSLDRRLKFIFCWMKSRTGTAGLPMTECRGATLPESPA